MQWQNILAHDTLSASLLPSSQILILAGLTLVLPYFNLKVNQNQSKVANHPAVDIEETCTVQGAHSPAASLFTSAQPSLKLLPTLTFHHLLKEQSKQS